MDSLMQWFSMGGYAQYVWSAYGLVSLLLVFNGLSCRWQKKRIEKSLKIWFRNRA